MDNINSSSDLIKELLGEKIFTIPAPEPTTKEFEEKLNQELYNVVVSIRMREALKEIKEIVKEDMPAPDTMNEEFKEKLIQKLCDDIVSIRSILYRYSI